MLSREEIDAILARLVGMAHLFVVVLLYGSGRLEECLNLRVKDIDFDRHQIMVRQGKGQKDRATMLAMTYLHVMNRGARGVKNPMD